MHMVVVVVVVVEEEEQKKQDHRWGEDKFSNKKNKLRIF